MSRWDRNILHFEHVETHFNRSDKLFSLGLSLSILLWLGFWGYIMCLPPAIYEFQVNGETYHGRGILLDNAYRIKTTDGRTLFFPLSSTVIKRKIEK